MATAVDVNHELLGVAERLATEYRAFPAGSVLRCHARAVRGAWRRGVSMADLPVVSERLARAMLDGRPA